MKWDDLRFFLAVRDAGSINGAARALRVDQSTVSRRVAALEKALAGPLFDRRPEGLVPNDVGLAIAPVAERIALLVAEVGDVAQVSRGTVEGSVTLATSPILASHFLMPLMPRLQTRFPHVKFSIQSGIDRVDLKRRQADIALRTHPSGTSPGATTDIARKVGTFGFALYASAAYVEEQGRPEEPIRDLSGHRLVVSSPTGPDAQWNSSLASPGQEVLVAFPYAATMDAVKGGVGVAVLPCLMADGHPGVERLSGVLFSWELWLVTNDDARTLVRVREVKDALLEALDEGAPLLSGVRASA